MRWTILYVLIMASFSLGAQELTPKLEEKAKKNAELEIKNLPPKGWEVNGMNISFEEMITKAWEKRFSMANANTPYYIAGYGNGTGKTVEKATEQAIQKAKDQLPGLVILYFSTWNNASDYREGDKIKIDEAISASGDAIKEALSKIDQDPDVNIVREKRGNYNVSVRYFWDQMKIRDLTRELIMKELGRATKWDREKMTKMLTYEQ